jgi:AcrR family transcriptional regulator
MPSKKTPSTPPPPADPAHAADGRVQRSIVTRKKIVAALAELIREGYISPTAEQVAARADVGLRTVFRHFDDMDSLYREIAMDLDTGVQRVLQERLSAPTWQERLLQSIDYRSDIFDRVAPLYVAAQVHRHESPYLQQNLMDSARLQHEQLRRLLPPAVAQDTRWLAALDLLLSFEAWVRLRREQGLDAAQAKGVMRLAVQALLGQLPPQPPSPPAAAPAA